jgi:hypothetical protein
MPTPTADPTELSEYVPLPQDEHQLRYAQFLAWLLAQGYCQPGHTRTHCEPHGHREFGVYHPQRNRYECGHCLMDKFDLVEQSSRPRFVACAGHIYEMSPAGDATHRGHYGSPEGAQSKANELNQAWTEFCAALERQQHPIEDERAPQ